MDKQAVMITGASTGIGFSCAERMAQRGHRVFAGVRKLADAERLQRSAGDNITPVVVDVTEEQQVTAAADQIAQALQGAPLRGLVNNAGVALGGPLELVSMGDFKRQFDVNVFGAVAMTKALLPQLRASKGRIVNISSVSGMVAMAGFAPYASSKFAMEAVTDALRRELRAHGVFACAVQPGSIRTPIWDKGKHYATVTQRELSAELSSTYSDLLGLLNRIVEQTEAIAEPPDSVADAVEHALTSAHPRIRYRVGPNSGLMRFLSWLPTRTLDLLIARV